MGQKAVTAVGTYGKVTDAIGGQELVTEAVVPHTVVMDPIKGQEFVTGAVGASEVVAYAVEEQEVVTDAVGTQEVVTTGKLSAEILSVLETRFEVETAALSLGLGLIWDTFEGVCSTAVDSEVVVTLGDGVSVIIEVVAGSLEQGFKGSNVTFGISVVRRLLNAGVVVLTPDGTVAVDVSDCRFGCCEGTEVGMAAWTVEAAAVIELRKSTLMLSSVLKSSSSQMQKLQE